jgi:NAD(P)H-dependent FMN reductase
MEQIQPVSPYRGDYYAIRERIRLENGNPPEIGRFNHDIDQYGILIIGTPVWDNSLPGPVISFLDDHDWNGIKIHPFFSVGGIYLNAYSTLKDKCKGAGISDPLYVIYDLNGNLIRIRE